MIRLKIKTMLATFVAAMASTAVSAQIPNGYYDSLKGKKGAELKTAIYDVIKDANTLDYGSGKGKTWWGFWETDRTDDGKFIDRYSPRDSWQQSTSQGATGSGMNIEHSFAKSWWGGQKNQAYCDLYNLMPCEHNINSAKSNYPMGKVVTPKTDNGATKVGKGSDGKNYWEPADEWKGDFARGYMYMATCYKNLSWTGEGLNILQKNDYPTLKEWAYTLFLEWARQDQVNALEVTRNNKVSNIQGNRNPYVDFPNLMEYVWGDSVDYEFDPAKTLCSQHYKENGGTVDPTPDPDPDQPNPGEEWQTIYTANYRTSDGGCSVEAIQRPTDDVNVWVRTKYYGWAGSGYISSDGTRHRAEGFLVLPEFDFSNYKEVKMSFSHVQRYTNNNPASLLSVEVRCEDTTTKLDGFTWASEKDWKFVDSGDIDLSAFAGKKATIAFHYTNTDSTCPTWEIADIAVSGVKGTTDSVVSPSATSATFDPSRPYSVYDLNGRRMENSNTANGIFIVKQGKNTFKTVKP